MEETKKSLIAKTWKRCVSMSSKVRGSPMADGVPNRMSKVKSWPRQEEKVPPPVGWFSIYVGSQRERFVIRAAYLNHPLFRPLLKEAEMKFGYANDGPLELPCNADHFRRLLCEVEQDIDEDPVVVMCPSPLQFQSSYELLNPARSPWKLLGRSGRSYSASQLKY